jgi:hypothetical protein
MPEGMTQKAHGFEGAAPIEEDMRVVSRQRLLSRSMHKT